MKLSDSKHRFSVGVRIVRHPFGEWLLVAGFFGKQSETELVGGTGIEPVTPPV